MIGKKGTVGEHQRRRGGAYFIGKLAWQKGLEELISLLVYTSKRSHALADCLDGGVFAFVSTLVDVG